MFVGHVGAALAIGRAERRVNVGVYVTAALLLDLILWSFILLGWESVFIPADFGVTHQAKFEFPWSHGLLASIGWSALVGVVGFAALGRLQQARAAAAALISAAVMSHWLLDALVHAPELPVAGPHSMKLGLGLWTHLPLALLVEAGLAVVGLCLFIPNSGLSRLKATLLTVLTLLLVGFTAAGMTVAPPPPSASIMAWSSLITLIAVCALFWWLGRLPGRALT